MACFSLIVAPIVWALSLDAFSASDTLITDSLNVTITNN